MPWEKSGGGGSKKKKRGGLWGTISRIPRDTLRGGRSAVQGLAPGIVLNAKALAALQQGNVKPAYRIGRDVVKQTKTDVRHPLRNPFNTLLTALAIASAGAGGSARVAAGLSAASKARSLSAGVKAAGRRPVYKRSFAGISQKPGRIPARYELQANRNPLARLGRKGLLDPAYKISKGRAERSIKKRFESEVKPLRAEAQKQAKAVRALEANFKKGNIKDLPPKPGYKRLYRGEGKADTNPMDDLSIPYEKALDRGGWFTDNKKVAADYAKKNKGQVYYLDVEEDIARMFGRIKPDYGWWEARLPEKYRAGKKPTSELSKQSKEAARKELTTLRKALREQQAKIVKTEKQIASTGPGKIARGVERRERYTRERLTKQGRSETPEGVAVPKFNLRQSPKNLKGALGEADVADLWNLPMNSLRAGMVTRPRYLAQNLPQTLAMLLMEQGPIGISRSINTARKLRKTDPDLPPKARSALGDPGQGSGAIGAHGLGSLTTSRLAHIFNVPESRLRELAFYGAARDIGLKSPKGLRKALENPKGKQYQMSARAAEDAVGAFSRTGGPSRLGQAEAKFMRSGIPIFYPMWKALARYGMQFPTKHSIQAALYNQMFGVPGKQAQVEGLGGEPAPYLPYIMATGRDKTSNPQNLNIFSPGVDVSEALLGLVTPGGPDPTRNIGQYLGPAPEIAWGALTGRNIQTGWELPGIEEGGYPGLAALKDAAFLVPGFDLAAMSGVIPGVKPRTTKAYGTPSREEQFLMWLLGPSFPRKTNLKAVRKKKKR